MKQLHNLKFIWFFINPVVLKLPLQTLKANVKANYRIPRNDECPFKEVSCLVFDLS